MCLLKKKNQTLDKQKEIFCNLAAEKMEAI